uniref:Malectin domain-containing protein n=1 Tax=Vitis vinifera TaxID=29760 RepID=F6HRF3_VITVI
MGYGGGHKSGALRDCITWGKGFQYLWGLPLCLTGNRLNGNIPDGIKGRQSRTNLFRSFSEEGNLGINMKEVQQNFILTDDWGFSSTGHFWDHNRTINDYIAQNVSVLGMNHSGLYTKARLSPLSFTYYGRCLADGNYTVKIHFAEIIIRGNKSFHSLGRQIFNVYIQGKLESEDFDIVPAAQGVEKVVVKEFKAVVKNKTLEVRFHWAGKGTTAIPSRGTYGPLISAISMESGEFRPYSFLKLDKFHMEQMEEEVTARNAHIHQQKVGSLECFMVAKSSAEEFSKTDIVEVVDLRKMSLSFKITLKVVLMHDFIIRYNVMAPTLGLVSYLPILETYFINNLARVRSLQLELKSRIEEFEKLDKFHMEQIEEEVTARNAHIHQQKVGSLECFMVAKSSAEEFSKTDIVEGMCISPLLYLI